MINNDGTGGESIYGMVFRDENMTISHDSRYLVTMVKTKGRPHTNNSQFMITLAPQLWLDNRQVVVGRVMPGTSRDLVDYIEANYATTSLSLMEVPLATIRISACAIL